MVLVIALMEDDEAVLECGGGSTGNKSNSTDAKSNNNGGMRMVIPIKFVWHISHRIWTRELEKKSMVNPKKEINIANSLVTTSKSHFIKEKKKIYTLHQLQNIKEN